MRWNKDKAAKMLLGIAGIIFIGIGVSFNASAALGNDPIGIVYDGIRNAANLSPEQLGMTSNIVNIVLIIIVFLAEKHYVSIGTLVHLLFYGNAVSVGGKIYQIIFGTGTLLTQMIGAVVGCTFMYLGVAMFITADMGLDPFTGLVMVLRDKTKKEFQVVKISFDVGCIAIGFLLGGKLGVITVITAVTAGPVIQFLSGKIERLMGKVAGKSAK